MIYLCANLIQPIGMVVSLSADDEGTVGETSGHPSGAFSYSIQMTWAEVEAIKSIMHFCIPRLLGFDKVWTNADSASSGGDSYY